MKRFEWKIFSEEVVQEAPSEMPNLASEDEEEMLKKAIAMSLEEQ